VEEYAKKLNIKYQDRIELLKHSDIIKMFEQRIESLQKELAHFEQVKKFTLLSQAFSVKLGEITPTLKLRRKVIMERYHHIIDSMYSNNKENKENKE
jgi:long-chain acyl-CoA synthetase